MKEERKAPLVSFLERLAKDENRAALAALRRGLGKKPGAATEMMPYICPFLSDRDSLHERGAKFMIASLFAWHPESATMGNLGDHLKRIPTPKDSDSTARRFKSLLNCNVESLHYHLRQAVSLLKSKGIHVNWHRLYDDIRYWSHPEKFVQQKWARSFWSPSNTKDNNRSTKNQ